MLQPSDNLLQGPHLAVAAAAVGSGSGRCSGTEAIGRQHLQCDDSLTAPLLSEALDDWEAG